MKFKFCGLVLVVSLIIAVITPRTQAQANFSPGVVSLYKDSLFDWYKESLSQVPRLGGANSELDSRLPQSCKAGFDRLFSKRTVKLSLFGGYSENEFNGQTLDGAMAEAMFQKLQEPCSRGFFACDFRAIENGRLQKLVLYKDQEFVFDITIHTSSVSYIDSENRTHYRDLQEQKSHRTRDAFLNALSQSDIVIYDGHSRDGGGPDFFPAKKSANGHIDYSLYQKHKPGLKDMVDALKAAAQVPQIVALLSCSSERHFLKSLRQVAPTSTFITTSQAVPDHVPFLGSTLLIDAIAGQKCNQDLEVILKENDLRITLEKMHSMQ